MHAALKADRSVALDEKRARDRKIGTALQGDKGRPANQLRGWLTRVELPGWRLDGHAGAQAYHVVGVILALVGLIVGWGTAQLVLHYTGDAPINIINALVVLILPQLVLLVFWVLAALPVRLPLLGGLRAALGALNPGRFARLVAQRFSFESSQRLQVVWEPENAVVLAPAARWLFSFWSQVFAFTFNVGALLAVLYLVAFSDLAFGWNTTLAMESATFYGIVSALAWPWHWFATQAVPSAALVEASRFYRLDGAATAQQAAQLGAWWTFLVAALVTYGLLPRLLTLLISWRRFHHHLRRALVRMPGAPELLARMNTPLIRTVAPRPEATPEVEPHSAAPRAHVAAPGTRCALVSWSGAVADEQAVRGRLAGLGIQAQTLLHAGGAQSTPQDRATVEALCRERKAGVAIVVKAWEPPLLEFVDFVQQVRARCARGAPIIVLLWGGGAPAGASDVEVWTLALRQLKDPDLHIEAVA